MSSDLRTIRLPLVHGGGRMPALGFGTLLPNTQERTADAIQAGFRHFDCAERYHNEREVGAALQSSGIPREDLFVTSKVRVPRRYRFRYRR